MSIFTLSINFDFKAFVSTMEGERKNKIHVGISGWGLCGFLFDILNGKMWTEFLYLRKRIAHLLLCQ